MKDEFEIRPVYVPFSEKVDFYELVIPITKSKKFKIFQEMGLIKKRPKDERVIHE